MRASKRKSTTKKTTGAKRKRRILLLDDHSVMRQGLKAIINHEPDLAVCGEAADARTALTMVEKAWPDLILVDISLPGTNGIEFIKNLKSRYPEVSAVVLSMHDESLYAERALRAGALAYIQKKECAVELLKGIRSALKGDYHLSPLVSGDIFCRFFGRNPENTSLLSVLSDRELEVFELLGRGLGRADIAAELNVSPKTIDAHKEQMKRKLGLASSRDLGRETARWVEKGGTNADDTFEPRSGNAGK